MKLDATSKSINQLQCRNICCGVRKVKTRQRCVASSVIPQCAVCNAKNFFQLLRSIFSRLFELFRFEAVLTSCDEVCVYLNF